MAQRVAVIRGGNPGLTCIKCCLDEGLEPVCFESSDDIRGLWRFKETTEPERSSIYRSLVVNTSKEMMCFSDFPMPAHFPNFMHNSLLLQYFRLYAEHFDLLKYIHLKAFFFFRHDFSHSGQWEVVTESSDGCKETHVFDAVFVCSGHFTRPVTPLLAFPGVDTFPGKCLHSWDYKDPEAFCGKRVLFGNSGGDIAVEISRFAEKNGPEGELTLFRRVFPLSLEHPTLAFIGFLNATGPIMPLAEMQARWVTRVFTGQIHLPPLAKMQRIIKKEMEAKINRYSNPASAALEVDYVPYIETIAQEVGVRPNLLWLFLTDPGLSWRVLFGPTTPYQYRLRGPGRWEGGLPGNLYPVGAHYSAFKHTAHSRAQILQPHPLAECGREHPADFHCHFTANEKPQLPSGSEQ
ncbi:flavin-containing monooxygenase 5-like [Hoplias malabaricus]|uniref:flavin-containing monooxygenase 5-like n=1 Tax=Hoplias malabaricus TaxID=27720 RepID=UPI0034623AE7